MDLQQPEITVACHCVLPHCAPQVARIDDSIIAATSSSNGGIYLLMMQLPPVPGASSADLQVRPGCLWAHRTSTLVHTIV
jgi:hypothetical protein